MKCINCGKEANLSVEGLESFMGKVQKGLKTPVPAMTTAAFTLCQACSASAPSMTDVLAQLESKAKRN